MGGVVLVWILNVSTTEARAIVKARRGGAVGALDTACIGGGVVRFCLWDCVARHCC